MSITGDTLSYFYTVSTVKPRSREITGKKRTKSIL